jgi:outer membrane lipoprotein-sorting protein
MHSPLRRSAPVFVICLLAGFVLPAFAQEGPLDPAPPKGITPEEIIQRFAAKEKQFKEAREDYTYEQSVKIQTLDGGTVDGEYEMVTDVLFDPQGRRTEQVVYAPQSSLERVQMTQQDFDDIQNRYPFVLTSDEIGNYNITYVGQQQEDELHTYVFDVDSKMSDDELRKEKKRAFRGRIWVDDRDFQIVKTYGKPVPDYRKGQENLFPKFVTYRQQIDGKYWFPTYTKADDVLHFSGGRNALPNDVHIRIIVRYTNYKRFGAEHKIIFQGQEVPQAPQQTPPPPDQSPN